MIRRIIDIKKYWRVIVYYEVDYDLFSYIEMDLNAIGCHANKYKLMKSKAFTCSNIEKHISVVGINSTDDRKDFINSVVHESEHIK